MTDALHEEIKYILGQSIFDHELVKGHYGTYRKINESQTLKQVLNILGNRYKAVHNREMIYGCRYLYNKFIHLDRELNQVIASENKLP